MVQEFIGICFKLMPLYNTVLQHNMEKNKAEVVSILFEKNGYLYVCGDAKNMAKNVREVLTQCVQSIKGTNVNNKLFYHLA